jgi:hypothetical protein
LNSRRSQLDEDIGALTLGQRVCIRYDSGKLVSTQLPKREAKILDTAIRRAIAKGIDFIF